MPADAAEINAESAAPALPKQRLQTLESLDGRTRASQRAYAIMKTFEDALGGKPSAGQLLAIRRAGMLCALEEDATARVLSGETVDLDGLVRVSNLARRAVLDLHLPKAMKPAAETLEQYLARTYPAKPDQDAPEEAGP